MDEWKPLILLVEDDEHILFPNQRMLTRRGYDVLAAASAEEARALLAAHTPDLIVLDVMLPDGNGYDLCTEFRKKSDNPVLFLSGLAEDSNKVRGMNLGGDYYLTKPCRFDELLAVTERLLVREQRVREKQAALTVLTRGPLTLDIQKSRALLSGADAGLTQKEFVLLLILMQNEGKALSGEQLYDEVWGTDSKGDIRTVRNHVYNIRAKLNADDADAFAIETVHNKGYRFTSQ
jgi:DNA-binding response OmpR family regulator